VRRSRKPRTTWLGRMIRGRRLDRNPLRRSADRIETTVIVMLLAAFFAGAPFTAHAAADWAYGRSLRVEQAQRATVRQVRAVLLHAATIDAYGTGATVLMAQGRWKAPDGQLRTGDMPVPMGATTGTTVLEWTTADGDLTSPPLQRSQVSNTAGFAGAAAVGFLAVMLAGIGSLTRWALDRRRLAAWDADWLANGPRWTSRRLGPPGR